VYTSAYKSLAVTNFKTLIKIPSGISTFFFIILEKRDYLLIFYLFLNFVHSSARQSVPVLIVNIVGIRTCSQHLLT